MTKAHSQDETKKYTIFFPAHDAREGDKHQRAFEAFRKAKIANASCWYADQIGTLDKCSGPLELHHFVVEFAVANSVDPTLLDKEFPDAGATQDDIDAWVQSSPENLVFLCEKHHRSASGVHTVDFANFKASLVAPDILP